MPQLLVARNHASPALGAVVVAAVDLDRAEHGVQVLLAVGDEVGQVSLPALRLLTAVASIDRQQVL